ncbi:hypothetical protein Q5P01_000367 [Channa striata]|uniref:Uncharacterized protein n=1 Tax=Channa striata TaxID=64152 RepID=A0AA88ILJ0_CHASR|nr:hypothetical protein Q5P01_000367 [Channa striata]
MLDNHEKKVEEDCKYIQGLADVLLCTAQNIAQRKCTAVNGSLSVPRSEGGITECPVLLRERRLDVPVCFSRPRNQAVHSSIPLPVMSHLGFGRMKRILAVAG